MNRKDIDRRKKFILELMGDPVYKPMRLRELSSLLRLSREEKRELSDVLDSLCEDGKITQDNKGRYSRITGKWKKKEKHLKGYKEDNRNCKERREKEGKDRKKPEGIQAEGIFIGHPKGFGFVEIEGQEEDIFIPEEDTGTAVNQDKVRIIIKDEQREGKRREGIVVEVLERGMEQIVGTYQLNRDFGFVISDNPKFSKDIYISRKNSLGAKNGDKVIAVVTD